MTMKADELRDMTVEDIETRVVDLKQKLMELRFKFAITQLEDLSQIGKVKKDIARAMTIFNEKRKSEKTGDTADN